MQSIVKTVGLAFVSLLAVSCASTTPLTQSDIGKIKTIAISSNLPPYPTFSVLGTTRLGNEVSTIPDGSFHERIITTASNYLQSKGYKVIGLSKDQNKNGKKPDMILFYYPIRGEYGGYGVRQHFLLGVPASPPTSFVSIGIVPSLGPDINRKASYANKSTKLTVKELTSDWKSLPQKDKDEIVKALNSDIELATVELMKQLGM